MELLDEVIAAGGARLLVVNLRLDEAVAIARIAGRAGSTDSPRRDDQSPAAVRRRLELHKVVTEEVRSLYMARGLLQDLDAGAPPDRLQAIVDQCL